MLVQVFLLRCSHLSMRHGERELSRKHGVMQSWSQYRRRETRQVVTTGEALPCWMSLERWLADCSRIAFNFSLRWNCQTPSVASSKDVPVQIRSFLLRSTLRSFMSTAHKDSSCLLTYARRMTLSPHNHCGMVSRYSVCHHIW